MTKVAVVGCGYWGPNIIRNFNSLDDCRVQAICDVDDGRLEAMRRRYPGAQTLTDYRRVLRDPDIEGIAICTPVHTHFPLASEALEAGKHVLVEKPLTHTAESSEALVELAEKKGLTLQVDHTFVYTGAVRKIRSIVDSGEIGELLYFDSVRVNLGVFQTDVNVIWDLATHDVSIMDYVIDKRPIWVSAIGSAHYGELENLAYLTMMFDDSLIAHVHINWLAPVKLRSTLIGGSKKMIVYDDLEPSEKLRVYEKGVTLNGDGTDRSAVLVDYRVGDMFAPYIDRTEPLALVCQTFVDAIRSGTKPPTDGEAGLRVVRVLEAAQTSVGRNGEQIRI